MLAVRIFASFAAILNPALVNGNKLSADPTANLGIKLVLGFHEHD